MVDSTKCKVFVVGFNLLGLDQQELTAFLESRPEVQNWRSAVPGQLFVIGSGTARDLASLIRNRFVGEFFFVAPIKPWYCNGCLPRESMEFHAEFAIERRPCRSYSERRHFMGH